MTGEWIIEIDSLGRPLTENAAHRMHYRKVSSIRKQYREAGFWLAKRAKIPALETARFEVWGSYPDHRSLPDPSALAPAFKGVLDGMVDARVLPDDKGEHVLGVSYLPPAVCKGLPPALMVKVIACT